MALTIDEYSNAVFASYVMKQLEFVSRVHLVWDVFVADSLKQCTREKRGSGQRRKVFPSTRIPTDLKGFLRVDQNKDELFKLLGNKATTMII